MTQSYCRMLHNLTAEGSGWLAAPFLDPLAGGGYAWHEHTLLSLVEGRVVLAATHPLPTEATAFRERLEAPFIEVLIPGFVNAHTHLELSLTDGLMPRGASFAAWARELTAFKMQHGTEALRAGTMRGLELAAQAGTTALADVASQPAAVPPLADAPMRVAVCAEALAISPAQARERHALMHAILEAARGLDPKPGAEVRRRISPHAPHTVCDELADMLRGELWQAGEVDPPVVHLAEMPAERALLERGTGEFRELFDGFGLLGPEWQPPGAGPVALAEARGWLRPPGGAARTPHHDEGFLARVRRSGTPSPARALLIHANDLQPHEAACLMDAPVAICWCPQTHAWFGHRPWPLELMASAGLPVVLGTDSLASAWSLSPLENLRQALRSAPQWPAAEALAAATLRARDAVLGRVAGHPPAADLTLLRMPGEAARRFIRRRQYEAPAALRELLLDPEVTPVARVVGGRVQACLAGEEERFRPLDHRTPPPHTPPPAEVFGPESV